MKASATLWYTASVMTAGVRMTSGGLRLKSSLPLWRSLPGATFFVKVSRL